MFRHFTKFCIVLALCFLWGCSVLPWTKPKPAAPIKKSLKINEAIDTKKLQRGGNVLIVPFTAGPGVAATEELDRIVLRIVKEIAEALAVQGSAFQIINSTDNETPDLIIKGRVTELVESGRFRKLIMLKKNFSLGVKGEIIDPKTESTVLVFSKTEKGKPVEDGYYILGKKLGQEIGKFIVQSANPF